MPRSSARALASAAQLVLSVLFVMPAATAAHAQAAHPLVGSWSIEYERGRRIENGEVTPIMGTARLVITVRGDSLVARFEPSARPDGTVPPPSTVVASAATPEVTFAEEQTATVTINGEQQQQRMTLRWTLNATGDVLGGTLQREMPMLPEPLPPTPVKGTRTRG